LLGRNNTFPALLIVLSLRFWQIVLSLMPILVAIGFSHLFINNANFLCIGSDSTNNYLS